MEDIRTTPEEWAVIVDRMRRDIERADARTLASPQRPSLERIAPQSRVRLLRGVHPARRAVAQVLQPNQGQFDRVFAAMV